MSTFRKFLKPKQSVANYITNGLLAWWKFNEGSGTTAIDSSGNGNTGTLVNSPLYVSGVPDSPVSSYALSFNGTDEQEVDTTTNYGTATSLNTFTITVWFKTGTASGNKLIGLENTQNGPGSYSFDRMIYLGANGLIYAGVYTSENVLVSSNNGLYDNNWHHAVFVCNSTVNIQLYIDGVLQQTTTLTGIPYDSYIQSYFRIAAYRANGWTGGADGWYTGLLSDIRIYNRVLSQSEITTIYNLQG